MEPPPQAAPGPPLYGQRSALYCSVLGRPRPQKAPRPPRPTQLTQPRGSLPLASPGGPSGAPLPLLAAGPPSAPNALLSPTWPRRELRQSQARQAGRRRGFSSLLSPSPAAQSPSRDPSCALWPEQDSSGGFFRTPRWEGSFPKGLALGALVGAQSGPHPHKHAAGSLLSLTLLCPPAPHQAGRSDEPTSLPHPQRLPQG